MITYVVKPQFENSIIEVRIPALDKTITLDTTKKDQDLFQFWKYQEFRKFIDQVDTEELYVHFPEEAVKEVQDTFDKLITPYKGIQNETSNNEETRHTNPSKSKGDSERS